MIRIICLLLLFCFAPAAQATEAGWALLREGGHVVLLRHAYAAGTSDAAQIDLDDCHTQRALSDRGRQQARRIGSLMAARGQPVDKVYTSRFCRTRETADLAFGSAIVEDLAALDPIGETVAEQATRTEVIGLVENYTGSGNLVLVTHDAVIRSLTGSGAREGEAVIVRVVGETLQVAGRIVLD